MRRSRRGRPAVRAAVTGAPLSAIGAATERAARRAGVAVYPELTGHGIGRTMHEPPTVPNVAIARLRRPLNESLVLAIEPMVGLGDTGLVMRDDGWTIVTVDRSLSAHAEHTIVVRTRNADILTAA